MNTYMSCMYRDSEDTAIGKLQHEFISLCLSDFKPFLSRQSSVIIDLTDANSPQPYKIHLCHTLSNSRLPTNAACQFDFNPRAAGVPDIFFLARFFKKDNSSKLGAREEFSPCTY